MRGCLARCPDGISHREPVLRRNAPVRRTARAFLASVLSGRRRRPLSVSGRHVLIVCGSSKLSERSTRRRRGRLRRGCCELLLQGFVLSRELDDAVFEVAHLFQLCGGFGERLFLVGALLAKVGELVYEVDDLPLCCHSELGDQVVQGSEAVPEGRSEVEADDGSCMPARRTSDPFRGASGGSFSLCSSSVGSAGLAEGVGAVGEEEGRSRRMWGVAVRAGDKLERRPRRSLRTSLPGHSVPY